MQSDASSDGSNAADQVSGDAEGGTAGSCDHVSDCPPSAGASCAALCPDGSNPCAIACVAHQCVERGCPNASTDAGDAGDAAEATDAGVSDGFGSGSPCPASVPATGGACAPVGLACEYGDAIQIGCDTVSTCAAAGWQVQSAATCSSSQPDGGTCPATIADVPNGVACTPSGQTCEYPTGLCYCTIDHTGAPLIWTCFPQTGCPSPRPRLGDVCATDGQQCDYSTCGSSIRCSQGTWHTGNGGCHP